MSDDPPFLAAAKKNKQTRNYYYYNYGGNDEGGAACVSRCLAGPFCDNRFFVGVGGSLGHVEPRAPPPL